MGRRGLPRDRLRPPAGGSRPVGAITGGFEQMFVFKAAVVGAGTMGGEIAQTLASADLPVVLKDVDQKFVDQGLAKAREVTNGQLQGLVKKEKISAEQAEAKLEETMGLIT